MFKSLRNLFRKIRKSRTNYTPLIEVRIYSENLIYNLRAFQKSKKLIAPVLKSNAYGHGLVEVAKIFDKESIPFLVVDSYYEALILRNENISSAILIIGYTPSQTIKQSKLSNVSFMIGNSEQIDELKDTSTNIHLKVDTGMNRQGISPEEIDNAFTSIEKGNLNLSGVFSHLSDADGNSTTFTEGQISKWNDIAFKTKQLFPSSITHLSATTGNTFAHTISADAMRVGIGLYGITTNIRDTISIKPALSMQTMITSIKDIKLGDNVGYNSTFIATNNMTIATIPVGYFEGIDRRLSNKGSVVIHNTNASIIGRVSMNITSVDISNIANIKIGTPVTVISNVLGKPNSIVEMAKTAGTIPYELLVHIPGHLRRTVV